MTSEVLAGPILDALQRAEIASRADVRTRAESPEVASGVSKRMNATVNLALKVEAGTLSPAAARLALAAGGYGPEVVARIDALEVAPVKPKPTFDPMAELAHAEEGYDCKMALVVIYSRDPKGPLAALAQLEDTSIKLEDSQLAASQSVYQGLRRLAGHEDAPEHEAGIEMGVDCVQRLMDEAGPGETVADVLNRLLAVSDRSRLEYSGGGPGPGRRQALVVTYSDSGDGPLSMFVDLEGEDGTALDPLAFTDAGRALVVGLEAIAAKTEEAS